MAGQKHVERTIQTLGLVILLGVCYTDTPVSLLCEEGEYVHTPRTGPQICGQCLLGHTYMDKKNHNESRCYNCSIVVDEKLEIIKFPCNRTRDTVIVCIEGHFRRNATENSPAACLKCKTCPSGKYPAVTCGGYIDTVCCPNDGYAYSANYSSNPPECAQKRFNCGQGEFLDKSSLYCKLCQDGFYMKSQNHSNTDCSRCPESSEYEPLTVESCRRTDGAIFGCKHGYFMGKNSNNRNHKPQCHPCTNCTDGTYVGRSCGNFSDTFCCPQPDMNVVDDKCVSKSDPTTQSTEPPVPDQNTKCGVNQFLSFDKAAKKAVCKNCSTGTYREESNHTFENCSDCSEYGGQNLPDTCDSGISENSNIAAIVLGVIVGVIIIIFLVIIFIVIIFRRNRNKQAPPPQGMEMQSKESGADPENAGGNANHDQGGRENSNGSDHDDSHRAGSPQKGKVTENKVANEDERDRRSTEGDSPGPGAGLEENTPTIGDNNAQNEGNEHLHGSTAQDSENDENIETESLVSGASAGGSTNYKPRDDDSEIDESSKLLADQREGRRDEGNEDSDENRVSQSS